MTWMMVSSRWLRLAAFVCAALSMSSGVARAHDVTTRVTWNREISRIVFRRCASCHQPGGGTFSLATYREASPWARAIKSQVLLRQMPPWGAVRGFGTFRNDEALSQEEIDLISNWVDGGFPEGNPEHLPIASEIPARSRIEHGIGELSIHGDDRLRTDFVLEGLWVSAAPPNGTARITIGPTLDHFQHVRSGRLQPADRRPTKVGRYVKLKAL